MTEQLFVLIVLLASFAGIVAVVYLDNRRPPSNLRELQQTMQHILANTEKIDGSLNDQRRVLNDADKKISAVTKGVEKSAR